MDRKAEVGEVVAGDHPGFWSFPLDAVKRPELLSSSTHGHPPPLYIPGGNQAEVMSTADEDKHDSPKPFPFQVASALCRVSG